MPLRRELGHERAPEKPRPSRSDDLHGASSHCPGRAHHEAHEAHEGVSLLQIQGSLLAVFGLSATSWPGEAGRGARKQGSA